MHDKDTSLIWESFLHEKKEVKVRKGNKGQPDKPDCVNTSERVEKPKKGKGSYDRKKKHSKDLEEARLNEVGGGGFSGQGSPEQASWLGSDTSDAVSDDDINGRVGEISSQIRTLDNWIDHVLEFGDFDNEEVWDDLTSLQQAINGFVMKYNVEESSYTGAAAGGVSRDDDYRGEDPEPRETDQDRYGYQGDRG